MSGSLPPPAGPGSAAATGSGSPNADAAPRPNGSRPGTRKPRLLVCLSGGLDSSTLMAEIQASGGVPIGLFIDYGQTAREREAAAAAAITAHLKTGPLLTARVPPLSADTQGHYPARNLLLLAVAAARARQSRADALALGVGRADAEAHVDAREPFLSAAAAAVAAAVDPPLTVLWPYAGLWKPEIHARAIALGVPIASTWSCWTAGPAPCHGCRACRLNDALSPS